MTALDDTIAGMPAAAHETMADVIERGAQAMYVRPWKIGETILNRSEWPVPGKSLGDLLEALMLAAEPVEQIIAGINAGPA